MCSEIYDENDNGHNLDMLIISLMMHVSCPTKVGAELNCPSKPRLPYGGPQGGIRSAPAEQ